MSVNIKENNALTRVAGNAADLNKWIGTKAEWDALDHDTIPEGTEVIITDDEYPNKVCRTVSECVDNTDENALAGASTVKEMNDNLSFPDGIGFYPDIKDGIRGYNTDAARGADTFFPFKSIPNLELVYNINTYAGGVSISTENGKYYILIANTATNSGYDGTIIVQSGATIIQQQKTYYSNSGYGKDVVHYMSFALVCANSDAISFNISANGYSSYQVYAVG